MSLRVADGRRDMAAKAKPSGFASYLKKFAIGLAVSSAAVVPLGVFGAATASADPGINVVVGGNGDNLSFGLQGELQGNGSILPGEISVPVNYPASMAPIGDVPTDQSIAIGVQNTVNAVHDALNRNPGQAVTLWGFSLGAGVTNQAAAQLRAQGIVVTVKNSGDGWSATGITKSPLAQSVGPMVEGLGIPLSGLDPVPSTVEKLDANDLWASNWDADWNNLGKVIDNAMSIPTTHRVIGAGEVPDEAFTKDGVLYLIYNGTIPVPPGGELVPIPPQYLNN